VTLIHAELAPLLIGRDPRDITALWEALYNGSRAHYVAARAARSRSSAGRGITLSAISGIDIALWDLLGKSLGQPVWRLLGGRLRDRIPAYASGGWAPVGGVGKQLRQYVERGHRAVKMRVGLQDASVDDSAARVREARETLGPGVGLMVDAHGTWSVREAQRFARKVEDCDLGWLEEPVSPDNVAGQAEVRATTDIPIAAGESEQTRFAFRDLIEARAVDVLQPDVAIAGRHHRDAAHLRAGRHARPHGGASPLGRRGALRLRPAAGGGHALRDHPRVLARARIPCSTTCSRSPSSWWTATWCPRSGPGLGHHAAPRRRPRHHRLS
jgi:L-alanine-DL-glutamate epimerase-like enolase superfamily enzyme